LSNDRIMSIHSRARRSGSFHRSGFTLVELLVVITIIGMLMAMVFPAFSSVFELMRQTTCRQNLQNINRALDLYATGPAGGYPGLVETGKPSAQFPGGRRYTWAVGLLNYMEKKELYNSWNAPQSGGAEMLVQRVRTYICPSDEEDPESEQQLSYVINAGTIEDGADPRISGGATLPRDIEQRVHSNGIAFNRYVTTGVAPRVTKANLAAKGLGQTLVLSENIQAWNYGDKRTIGGAPQPYDGAPTSNRVPSAREAQMYTGFVWNGFPINYGKDEDEDIRKIPKAPNDPRYARPSSSHPNLVMMAFADGRAEAIRSDIAYHVYQLLCMTNPKRAVGKGRDPRSINATLNESDYLTQ
jgi:prepilin-type N-terminal cleavage/methylation domain-containing protein